MINSIYLNGSMLVSIKKLGRENNYELYDGRVLIGKKQIQTIEVECDKCKSRRSLSAINDYNLKKKTLCSKCKSSGEANAFYGKKHTNETKKKISKQNKGKLVKDKNPMFGKTVFQHWTNLYGIEQATKKEKERLAKISYANSGTNNPMYGKRITEEQEIRRKKSYSNYLKNRTKQQKDKISKALSYAQKKIYKNNPDKYISNRKIAGKKSIWSQGRFKKNKIEIKVEQELKNLGLSKFEYSVIFGGYQFDFGFKQHKILLEVQGDYWHGNPNIYKELNSVQVHKKQKDILKAEIANKHGFKLFYIWEQEINNGNFSILHKIKEVLNEI